MNNDINKLQKLIQNARKSAKNGYTKDLMHEMQLIKDILINILLMMQASQIKELIGNRSLKDKIEQKSGLSLSEAIENLAEIAVSKLNDNKKRIFLLHRPTEDYEYQKSAFENDFTTYENTEWFAKYMPSENAQKGANPVVSCWIPEESIESVPHPHEKVGTWGELGRNPFDNKYTAIVKPGKYQIHQELKQ